MRNEDLGLRLAAHHVTIVDKVESTNDGIIERPDRSDDGTKTVRLN